MGAFNRDFTVYKCTLLFVQVNSSYRLYICIEKTVTDKLFSCTVLSLMIQSKYKLQIRVSRMCCVFPIQLTLTPHYFNHFPCNKSRFLSNKCLSHFLSNIFPCNPQRIHPREQITVCYESCCFQISKWHVSKVLSTELAARWFPRIFTEQARFYHTIFVLSWSRKHSPNRHKIVSNMDKLTELL